MIIKFNFKILFPVGANKFTNEKLSNIKNSVYKKNVFDLYSNMIVNTIFLKGFDNNKRILIWTYYRDRQKKDVNKIIEKYKRENLIINYSVLPKSKKLII
jgi:hypothetical protein